MNKFFSISVAFLGLVSCVSPEKMLEQQHKLVVQSYLHELHIQQNNVDTGTYKANWTKAKADLLSRGPRVVEANFRVMDSMEQRMQVWKDLIPSLTLSVSDSATIEDLSDLFVDTNFRVSSFFNFGDLLNMPVKLATMKLAHAGAELQAEQVMRNEVIGLYRLFKEQDLLDLEKQALVWEEDFIRERSLDVNGSETVLELEALEEKVEAYRKKREKWVRRVEDAVMRRFSNVKFSTGDMPTVHYRAESLNFSDSKRWGSLQMNLLALELLAEESNLAKAYRRYLPTPTLGVTAPPLLSNSDGQDFELDEFRLTPSVYWRLDTKGAIGKQIRRIKRTKPMKKWARDQRTRDEVSKLVEGKDELKKVQKELVEVNQLIEEYKKLVSQGYIKDLNKALDQMRKLKTLQISLRAKEVEICTSFWLLDESRWKETTKQWKRARLKMEKKLKKKK